MQQCVSERNFIWYADETGRRLLLRWGSLPYRNTGIVRTEVFARAVCNASTCDRSFFEDLLLLSHR